MALAETTLSAAVAVGDTSILVASASSMAVGRLIQIGSEVMEVTKAYDGTSTTVPVLRGVNGTPSGAWPSSARLVHGAPGDFSGPAQGAVVTYNVGARSREVKYYSAAGAITLPTAGSDMVAVLCGTALAMTLAAPTKDLDGCALYVLQDTAAAHTVTYSAGLGGAGGNYDVLTSNGSGTAAFVLMACNEIWVPISSGITGTLTNAGWAIA